MKVSLEVVRTKAFLNYNASFDEFSESVLLPEKFEQDWTAPYSLF